GGAPLARAYFDENRSERPAARASRARPRATDWTAAGRSRARTGASPGALPPFGIEPHRCDVGSGEPARAVPRRLAMGRPSVVVLDRKARHLRSPRPRDARGCLPPDRSAGRTHGRGPARWAQARGGRRPPRARAAHGARRGALARRRSASARRVVPTPRRARRAQDRRQPLLRSAVLETPL